MLSVSKQETNHSTLTQTVLGSLGPVGEQWHGRAMPEPQAQPKGIGTDHDLDVCTEKIYRIAKKI